VTRFDKARALSFAVPAVLLAGAWGSQLIGGLYPCEMCHWQRWPHYAALGLAALAFILPQGVRRTLVWLAALAILISGGIGAWHAGVEYGWWPGITHCTAPPSGSFADLINAPLIRCDQVQWQLFGISLAGYNAIISTVAALVIARFLVGKQT
jgi:disulfide bond formation protein DsbB